MDIEEITEAIRIYLMEMCTKTLCRDCAFNKGDRINCKIVEMNEKLKEHGIPLEW